MIIYKATNKINSKCYVGQTVKDLSVRKKKHLYASKQYKYCFYNAINKYGFDNFEWEVLCDCESGEEMDEMEFHYIKQYHSYKTENGYNMSLGGEGGDNYTYNPNKEKIIQNIKNNWKINGHPWTGRKHTEESKEKMSKSHKGLKHSEDTKEKFSEIRKNMVGEKNALSKKWKIIFPDGKEKIITSLRNFCNTFEKIKLDFAAMHRTANGKQKLHKGYRCEYCQIDR